MKLVFDEEIIRTDTYKGEAEEIEISMTKKVKKIEKFALRGIPDKTKVQVYYEGTAKEYKTIIRGENNSWIECSDYSPSYGSGSYSQRYSRDLDWFTDVLSPVIVHCTDETFEEPRHYEGRRENTWN